MLRPNPQTIKAWIHGRADNPVRNMKLFTSGCMLVILGLMLILLAERLLEPSVGQELFAALGLIVAFVGGCRALYGYLSMGLFKLLEYFLSDP